MKNNVSKIYIPLVFGANSVIRALAEVYASEVSE